ncbi:MAG: phage tail tube protein [Acholeplasmataceae bacterium]
MPFTGIGTVLKRGSVAIADVVSINGPGMARDTVDVTTLSSVGGYREFITGLRDGGTLTFEVLFSKTGYQALKTDFENDDAETYSVELPDDDSTIITFDGLVTDFPVTIPLDDKVSVSVTIKITGNISVT